MRPRLLFLMGSTVLAASLLAGCQSTGDEKTYSRDPLLQSRKPIEGVVQSPTPALTASADPEPPPPPRLPAGPAAPPRPREVFAADRPASGQASPGPRGTVEAMPVSRSGPILLDPPVTGKHGHAANHRWLQGTLEKHYQGHHDLRYCDPSVEDSLGGKVTLEEDPRLANFAEGDVVRVEGAIVPREEAAENAWSHYPRYRIREIWLIEPARAR